MIGTKQDNRHRPTQHIISPASPTGQQSIRPSHCAGAVGFGRASYTSSQALHGAGVSFLQRAVTSCRRYSRADLFLRGCLILQFPEHSLSRRHFPQSIRAAIVVPFAQGKDADLRRQLHAITSNGNTEATEARDKVSAQTRSTGQLQRIFHPLAPLSCLESLVELILGASSSQQEHRGSARMRHGAGNDVQLTTVRQCSLQAGFSEYVCEDGVDMPGTVAL